jgi:transcription-repair coupling factor (superfamily II helicase)
MFKSLKFYVSQTIKHAWLLHALTDFGYKRQSQVEQEGDFSLHGGIIDIFPVTFECPIRIELNLDKVESIYSVDVTTGRLIWKHQVVIVLPKKKIVSRGAIAFSEEIPIHNFINLKTGDYVVHVDHGIGKYLGIRRIRVNDKELDHFIVEYEGGDKLYVPVDQAHLIQKYIAFEGKVPKLYKLGSRQWQRNKERSKKGIRRLAWELLQTQALRDSLPGFAFSQDTDWQRQFEETFPYTETPDQIEAMRCVKVDMESPRPMDRLLCGDVGYGKTEVAMRAAFKAVMDNKQVAFLVPTTILAEQHYYNFTKRLKDFPVNVQMLSRFRTARQQEEIIEGLARGTVDIVIGTHRLLSQDLKFKDLGLVIIDEEQRFGVKDKEKLKHLRLLVDILTLTATPIPRTLYLSLMGARDMSVINTPPQNRIPVETHVAEFDDDLIFQAISRELKRDGQVYFVRNRIEGIDETTYKISRLVDSKKIAMAHGQMPSRQLESIMLAFLRGQIDILVCTMIIESGIDVPNANTLLVENADMFGLADLHQLRGRVGRFNKKAYAYFLIPRGKILSAESKKRLEAIEEFNELGSGFKIAFEDLQIRGAGNLLGEQQHGYIFNLGFDLYCRLLREAITEVKNAFRNTN